MNLELLAALLRDRRGPRSLRDIADETGVSASTLSRIENGEAPDLATFARLCAWLGCSADMVLFGSAGPPGPVDVGHLLRENARLREWRRRVIAVMEGE